MNKHLQQRIEALLALYDRATLATCGQAGVQINHVNYEVKNLDLHVFIPRSSDHLFNLETHSELVLLTSSWKLYGHGTSDKGIATPHSWQVGVIVRAKHLHILNAQNTVETIDF